VAIFLERNDLRLQTGLHFRSHWNSTAFR
jgi:hypothetical protein